MRRRQSVSAALGSHYLAEPLERRLLLSAYVAPVNPRTVTNLDANWKFILANPTGAQDVEFNDSAWQQISVPHTWNNLDGQDGGNNYYRGIGWYRQYDTPPAGDAGMELYLEFDGVGTVADVYVNGNFVGEHDGAYASFAFDVTQYMNVGQQNVIAVEVNNANNANIAPLGGDYTMDGGIYRHVNLIATEPDHVAVEEYVPADTSANPIGPTVGYWLNTPGVYLTPTNVSASSAQLQVKTDVRNDGAAAATLTVVSDIVDESGNLVQELTSTQSVPADSNLDVVQNTTISNPHLWDGVINPYLYQVYVSVENAGVVTDVEQQPLGFRFYSVNPNTGFTLNGQPYNLHGVSFLQDWENEGWAISDAQQEEDITLIQQIGATYVRLPQYERAPLTYTLLDEDGIAAQSELPLNGTNNAGVTNSLAFLNNAKQQLQEMIRQHYNDPAILFWGLFNELPDNSTTEADVKVINELAHQEDPTRLTTAASNAAPGSALNAITDVIGLNEYLGWYSGADTDVGPTLDGAHSGEPAIDYSVSEYGAGAAVDQHEDVPVEPPNNGTFHPEEYQNAFLESYYQQFSTRPYLWATVVWNMFDFASDGRVDGEIPGRNDKGLVTYDRSTMKDSFYFYQANWTNPATTPVLHIASSTYTNRDSNETSVQIFSNLSSVNLSINGISLGTISSANATDDVFQWNTVFLSRGNNVVTATSTQNGQTYTQTVTWTWNGVVGNVPALTGTPYARIDFEKSTSTTYPGYSADTGQVYGLQSDGLTYGWNVSNTGNSRDRTGSTMLGTPPDQRYETLVQAEAGGSYSWSIAVPNGVYDVHLVGGDPDYTDSIYYFEINGAYALAFTPTNSSLWAENIVRVDVTNGELTLTNGPSSSNDKIDYIDINVAAPPTAAISPVSPNDRSSSVSSMTITFSEQITGFDLSDLTLTLNGGSNVLTGAESLTTSDNGTTWILGNLSQDTTAAGVYALTLKAAGSGIQDDWTNALKANATLSFTIGPMMTLSGSNVYIKQDTDGEHIDAWVNSATPGVGTPTQKAALATTSGILFNGASGGDKLTLDLSAGDFAAGFASDIAYNGFSGGENVVEIIGSAGSDALSVTSSGISISGAMGTASIALANVPSIQFSGGTGGSDAIAFLSSPSGGYTFAAITSNIGLSITNAAVNLATSQQLSALAISGTGRLDVGGNTLTINYGSAKDPISAIAAYLAAGGIVSSKVVSENASQSALVYGIGYADGADGIASGLSSGQIEIMPTLDGDAKLQGNVVFGDFQLLSQYFGQSGTGWDEGNFTYGSSTTFGDFQLLSQNFGQTSSLGSSNEAPNLAPPTTSGNAASAKVSAVASSPSIDDDFVEGIWASAPGTADSPLFNDSPSQDFDSFLQEL